MAYANASIYYGNPETSPLTSPATGWYGMSTSDKLYAASGLISGVSNIASSIFSYKAAEQQAANSISAVMRQRDRQIREMTEAFVQQEAAEKVSLWESGLQYRGTAEAIEESNIRTRETELKETREYYDDLIADLRAKEAAAKRSSLFGGVATALGMTVGAIAGSVIPGAGTVAGAAIGGTLGGMAGNMAGSIG